MKTRLLNHRLPVVSALLLVTLVLSGCAGQTISPSYYTLKPVARDTVPSSYETMGIAPIVLPEWLNQIKMGWSDGGVNLDGHNHDRWAGPLGKIIDQTQLRNFSRMYPTTEISLGPWERSGWPERVVQIRILSLERQNNQLTAEASFRILDNNRKVVSHSFNTYQHPLSDQASADRFAEALSNLLGQLNQNIVQIL